MKNQYLIVANKTIRILIPYASSYLCVTGFSALAVINTKFRSRLNAKKEMKIALSKFMSRFDHLVRKN